MLVAPSEARYKTNDAKKSPSPTPIFVKYDQIFVCKKFDAVALQFTETNTCTNKNQRCSTETMIEIIRQIIN